METLETPDNPNSVRHSTEDIYAVQRPVYCLRNFDGEFEETPEDVTIKVHFKRAKEKVIKNCTCKSLGMRLLSFVPIFLILRQYYKRKYILYDVIAGFTLLIFHIPQGLAYGLLAGLQPINGLYTSFFPPLFYAFFGTSRQLSTGTFSLLSLIIADPVQRLATLSLNSSLDNGTVTEADIEFEKVTIAGCATFMAGALQIIMGILHLGMLTSYMSDALVNGLTTGAAVHVFTSQVITCLGLSIRRHPSVGKVVMIYVEIFSKIRQVSIGTLVASLICIVILVLVKELINPKAREKIKMPIPIELIIVIVAAIIGYFTAIDKKFGIKYVGSVPKGLPSPTMPAFSLFSDLIGDAISLTVVSFVVSVSLTKMMATKYDYDVDYNQELMALGISNIGGSFLRCHMAGGNLSRNAVMMDVGMRSQIANLVCCFFMLLVLLFMGEWFSYLPTCVLSSIIIVSLKGMFKQVEQLPQLWKVSIYDFLIWVISCLAVIFLDVTYGLATGFAFSLMTIVFRTQNPECRLIGRIPQTDIYKDITVYPEAQEIPGIKIFRFDGAIYFANAEHFKSGLYKLTNLNPVRMQSQIKKRLKRQARESLPERKKLMQPHGTSADSPSDPNCVAECRTNIVEMSCMTCAKPNPKVDNDHSDNPEMEVHHLILDCSTWAFIDSVGIRILKEVISQYKKVGVTILMAVLKAPIRDMFARTQLYETHDKIYMYLTVHDAVLAALSASQEMKNQDNFVSSDATGENGHGAC